MVESPFSSIVITGPPASGKSCAALRYFLAEPDALLLTPTATMAEHIRNELARALIPVRPSRIITLARFLDRTGAPAAAPKAILHALIEQSLNRLDLPRFHAVAEYRGFRSAVAALIEEAEIGVLPRDLAEVCTEVERALLSKGMALRNARLRAAADWNGNLPLRIVLDGFFTFSNAELNLIESLAARTQMIVTLPAGAGAGDWPRATAARSSLLAAGFQEEPLTVRHRAALQEVFCAPTLEQENEETARRILEEAERGRPFREMGIVLRSREPYAAALASTLSRFGIPARFYFADGLAAHPAVDFLAGIVRTMLGGWDHAELLRLLRMPISGVGATPDGDRFDFQFRALLPGRGLPLRARSLEIPPAIESILEFLTPITGWVRDRFEPVAWSSRIKTLRALIPLPDLTENVSAEQLRASASIAVALDTLDTLLDQTAALLGSAQTTLQEFWRQTEAALELAEIRVPDRRRNVVHVLDVFEARQWELPIVFVCGMVERHFPQYHRQDPLLDDASRRRAGLATSNDLQREERSLFELATTRATERTILSYCRFDDKGDPTLPSFFLRGHVSDTQDLERPRARPRPSRSVPSLKSEGVEDAESIQRLATAHRTLSPSSIERFLQCPFQFFAQYSLRLRVRPPAPRDRLDMLVQGSIIHSAIAALEEMPLLGVAVFDEVFVAETERLRVPAGYRREAVRLEMLRNFTAFLASANFSLGWRARVEEKFSIALTPELGVRGRIDRLEVGPNRQGLVIDYKYSGANKIRERVKDQDKGEVVQAGLYLLAAVKEFKLTPAGMLYCGLRKDVEWGGWHLPLPGLERIGESCAAARLDELTQAAKAKAIEVFTSITSGDIKVRPADEKKCAWCDYRDICRVETQ